eukprot:11950385-Karenia_brevis.AAC.1
MNVDGIDDAEAGIQDALGEVSRRIGERGSDRVHTRFQEPPPLRARLEPDICDAGVVDDASLPCVVTTPVLPSEAGAASAAMDVLRLAQRVAGSVPELRDNIVRSHT